MKHVHALNYTERYVGDTFTILNRENVDDFLQHLNNHRDRKRQQTRHPRHRSFKRT